jgi:hypothetical protein
MDHFSDTLSAMTIERATLLYARLALFGLAMTISMGIKSPLDYSVFSASAGAMLLALYARRISTLDEAPR